ncbi:MAG TPA: hypothetical protein VM734_00130 [Kofleriaceae bacterium]|jgi:hypothetical protein|nr:hypothetical protein [Kofleriaceae bacterium]
MASDDAGDPPEAPKDTGAPAGKGDISETLRQRLEALVPDLVRRTFTAGLGAVFSTEEGIRKITRELQLPSVAGNVAGYIADTAQDSKDKVLEIVAREVRDFLSHVNLSEEVAKLLTTLSFEIKTEIRFIPNSERYTGVDPDVKAAVRLKRNDKDGRDRDDDKESTGDRQGRLRRLWRRATEGNGASSSPADDVVDEPEDDLDRDE